MSVGFQSALRINPPIGTLPSPIISLDFVTNTYTNNGVPMTAADVVSDVTRLSGSGLSVISGSPVHLLNETLALLLTMNWTTIVTFQPAADVATTGVQVYLINIFDHLHQAQVNMWAEGEGHQTYYTIYQEQDNIGDFLRVADSFNKSTANVNVITKLGYTRTDTHSATTAGGANMDAECLDNTPVVGSSLNLELALCADASNLANEGFIRRIDIYLPQSDGIMVALTA